MNNRCIFGYCTCKNDNCQECGEKAKQQGYIGCIFATNKIEDTNNINN